MHETLKQLTCTYVLCTDCFEQGKYPSVLEKTDFEKTNLKSLLAADEFSAGKETDDETEDPWNQQQVTLLIDGIAEHQHDWQTISQVSLSGQKSPAQCVHKFLSLPMTDNMMAQIYHSRKKA